MEKFRNEFYFYIFTLYVFKTKKIRSKTIFVLNWTRLDEKYQRVFSSVQFSDFKMFCYADYR